MFVPWQQDLTARRNNDFALRFTLSEDGGPLVLTGCTLYMQVRTAPGSALGNEPWININSATANAAGSKLTLVTPASGIFEIFIDRLDLVDIPDSTPKDVPKTLYYDIIATNLSGVDETIVEGKFILVTGVTILP